jgi:peptide/nickel transport system ATP-binding protein
MNYLLEVQNLVKHFTKKNIFSFKGKSSTVKAVDDVSFGLAAGEILVLAGESGSGKSTIAKLILGAIQQDSGKIIFEGQETSHNKNNLNTIRMNCQMIQQDPYDSVNPRMKILDIISEPLEIHNVGNKQSRKTRVLEVLKEVKLEPATDIINKHPHMLSGGQRQRIVLARALVMKPKIIIADEPVSMLDVSIRAEMLEIMQELQQKYNITFIYITHDLATARYFGQKIAILYMGKIVEVGPIDDVLLNPQHPYTQALIDAISEPDPKNLYKERKEIRIKESDAHTNNTGCKFVPRCPYADKKCLNIEPKLEPIVCTVCKESQHNVACFFPLQCDHNHDDDSDDADELTVD